MKSSIFSFLLTVVVLVGLALPTPAAAASDIEKYGKSLTKRTGDPDFKRGLCVCTGGNLDRRAGVIVLGGGSDANGAFLLTVCTAMFFDETTGEVSDTEICDETWMPLPN